MWFLDTELFVFKMRELMKDDLDAFPEQKSVPSSSRLHAFFQGAHDSRREAVRVVLENSEPTDGQTDVGPMTIIPNSVFIRSSL